MYRVWTYIYPIYIFFVMYVYDKILFIYNIYSKMSIDSINYMNIL